MQDSREIAARLQQAEDAGKPALGELLAEKVEVRHVPALEMDGFFDREPLLAGGDSEHDVFKKVMPDFVSTTTYAARGDDEVVGTVEARGTLPDGSVLAQTTEMVLTLIDGQITRMTSYINTDNLARLMKALQESEAERPG
jgi:ketosteroid isomerase-like protein